MKVLITSPSLDDHENVSGISTMISNIIENADCEFVHFEAGRKDGEESGFTWFFTQLKLRFVFREAISRAKPDVIHINTAFEPRAMVRDLVLAKSAGKVPVILHVHGGRFLIDEYPSSTLERTAEKLLRAASQVIVLSDAEADVINKRTPGLNITVLPNAVPTSDIQFPDRSWGEKTIIYFGRLVQERGLSDMAEASRLLTNQGFKFRFSCFGEGRDKDLFLRMMTSTLGDRFSYGGVVTAEERLDVLKSPDILLMPSKFESLPMAVLEAMAAGCIPVVSNRGSTSSVVEDGRNGFLVDPGDLTQIVGRLKFLLSESETAWNEMRRNARQTVVDRFDLVPYLRELRSLYSKVANTPPTFVSTQHAQ
jgi:glycosyltransferase involved in cell wall biosynthesis